ncbi:hypothetical protein PV05_04945 [Exophiala xenobiotica]|uniref:Uncharacterized protein n=1 Tax=Exophiala xenobiotica TaxID=348802 RepID=A0A0D2END9_9EURO|nr:uncharacterized protein PV05_04945 [Exophiala xenobiotica]KIW56275.1 hypothetical protein PV05_04945 [Exophiala xenobiotica]
MSPSEDINDCFVVSEGPARPPQVEKGGYDLRSIPRRSSSAPCKTMGNPPQKSQFRVEVKNPPTEASPSDGSDESADDRPSDRDYEHEETKASSRVLKKKDQKSQSSAHQPTEKGKDSKSHANKDDKAAKPKKRRLPQNVTACHEIINHKFKQTSEYKAKVKARGEEISRLKDAKAEQKKTIRQLREELEESNKNVSQLEQDNEKLYNERMRLVGKDAFPPEPDDAVSSELCEIFAETMSFSKRWCLGKWSELDEAQNKQVLVLLQDHKSIVNNASARCVLAVQQGKIAPSVVLQALVNCVICMATFQRPFAHLRIDTNDVSDDRVETSMKFMLDLARASKDQADAPKAAHKLRADILRAIQTAPSASSERPSYREQELKMREFHDQYCTLTTNSFLHKCEPLLRSLNDDEEMTRREELLGIVKSAWQLTCRLAVQYFCTEVFFLEHLEAEHFALGHERYKPHRGMKLKEDKNDEFGRDPKKLGILGEQVDLLVEPLIRRTGDHKGNKYDKSKILHKAAVWVVAPSEVQDPPETTAVEQGNTGQYEKAGSTHHRPPAPVQPPTSRDQSLVSPSRHTVRMKRVEEVIWSNMKRIGKEFKWVPVEDDNDGYSSEPSNTARDSTSMLPFSETPSQGISPSSHIPMTKEPESQDPLQDQLNGLHVTRTFDTDKKENAMPQGATRKRQASESRNAGEAGIEACTGEELDGEPAAKKVASLTTTWTTRKQH